MSRTRETVDAAALRVRGWVLAATLLMLPFAAVSRADVEHEGGRIIAPPAGTVVHAGELVELRWTPLDDDVDEFELLLAVGGAQVRLTPMLEPSSCAYWWRVPNLPAEEAHLRLRAGSEGREIELAAGPAFRITGDDSEPLGRVTFRGGEWWTARSLAVYPQQIEAPERRARSRPAPEWARHELPSPRERDAGLVPADFPLAGRTAGRAPAAGDHPRGLDRQPLAPPQRK